MFNKSCIHLWRIEELNQMILQQNHSAAESFCSRIILRQNHSAAEWFCRFWTGFPLMHTLRLTSVCAVRHTPTLEDYLSSKSVKIENCFITFLTCFNRLIYIYWQVIHDILCKIMFLAVNIWNLR